MIGHQSAENRILGGVDVADVQPSPYLPIDPGTFGQLRILRIGDVELHLDGHKLVVGDAPVHLPHKEFMILRQLMDNAGRVVTRREFRDNVWGSDRTDVPNSLDVHIRRLRAKIDNDSGKPAHIRTVRGVGYIFDLPEDS